MNIVGELRDAVDDPVENVVLDEESRARTAALSMVEENRAGALRE